MSRGKPKVHQRKDGRWVARIAYTHPATGKRMEHSQAFTSRERAEARLELWISEREDGTLHTLVEKKKRNRYTVGDALDGFLGSIDFMKLAPSTKRAHENYADKVHERVGDMRLARIERPDVKELIQELVDEGRSLSYQRQFRSVLSKAFQYAQEKRWCTANPCQRVELVDPEKRNNNKKAALDDNPEEEGSKAPRKRKAKALTPDEVGAFLEAAKRSRFEHYFATLYYLGLRPSEATALRWGDYDREGRTLHVERSIDEDSGAEWTPKSAYGIRTLRLPKRYVEDHLEVHRRKILERAKKEQGSEATIDPHAFIFESRRHRQHLSQANTRKAFKRVLKLAGIDPKKYRVYDLRHTHATEMWRAGIDIKIIQVRLGHHSPAFTLQTYVHLFHAHTVEQLDRLDAFYEQRAGITG